MKNTKLVILVFLSVGLFSTSRAQSAMDFFHTGAQAYVGEELQEALNLVEAGLEIEPDNARLIALKEKIEEEQENQENQQGDNNEQSSENQQNQEENQQENREQQDTEEESEQQQDQQEEQQQDGDPQEDQQNQEQEQEARPDQNQPPDPDQLSKEQAERILQALENEEEKLLREIQKIKGRPRRVEKDW